MRVQIFECRACGSQTVTLSAVDRGTCPRCGELLRPMGALQVSIAWGTEEFSGMDEVSETPREDLRTAPLDFWDSDPYFRG